MLLEPTEGRNKGEILQAIDSLQSSGSTYVEDGLKVAYKLAADEVEPDRITRVMVLSDGVGNSGAESILNQIREHVDKGVTLTRLVSEWATTTTF